MNVLIVFLVSICVVQSNKVLVIVNSYKDRCQMSLPNIKEVSYCPFKTDHDESPVTSNNEINRRACARAKLFLFAYYPMDNIVTKKDEAIDYNTFLYRINNTWKLLYPNRMPPISEAELNAQKNNRYYIWNPQLKYDVLSLSAKSRQFCFYNPGSRVYYPKRDEICKFDYFISNRDELAAFVSMNCTEFTGRLTVTDLFDMGSKFELKFARLRQIIGQLYVHSLKIARLEFSALKSIVHTTRDIRNARGPALLVANNPHLKSLKFGQLSNITCEFEPCYVNLNNFELTIDGVELAANSFSASRIARDADFVHSTRSCDDDNLIVAARPYLDLKARL
ncbi:unnamed protein product [Caenorhabditis bovis]|uniref:Receptor L-domain domain-containing protein n=1 Tax=Caenorhabditis bovis TaxID=2654633 RepID=A0A8S1F0D9_9PELO|nr:unnamed protein product [Caenorhabditis bovis]